MLKFKDITLPDKSIFSDFEYICSDYIFSYLYMFCEIYRLQLAESDGSVIIRSCSSKPVFYMPLGDTPKGIAEVFDYCRDNKIKPVFAKIPGDYLKHFDSSQYKIEEDRNSFDYIFRNEDLSAYDGKDFRKQRNNLSNFHKNFNPSYTTDIYDHIEECRAFTSANYKKADICNPTFRILDTIGEFGCKGGIVWDGNTMLGFCIYQKVSYDTILSHVELTANIHRGIHAYMINEMSKGIAEDYINKEDDVGLIGLRRFKESYNPWSMFKKYTAFLE